jgi:hypothetical protein
MAKKRPEGLQKCKACGYPMIMDETIIQARDGGRIKRTFLHCVNGECGHIQRVAEFPVDTPEVGTVGRSRS